MQIMEDEQNGVKVVYPLKQVIILLGASASERSPNDSFHNGVIRGVYDIYVSWENGYSRPYNAHP